eukprot:4492253-Pyramimonas_sp.AAC.1
MDQPLFPEHFAEISGTPMVGQVLQNHMARDLADDFYRLQAARVPGAGIFPRVGYHPSPNGPDTIAQPLALDINPSASTPRT